MKIYKKLKCLSIKLKYRVRSIKIYTLEDPIEYIYPKVQSIPVIRVSFDSIFDLTNEFNYQKNTVLNNFLPYITAKTIKEKNTTKCTHKVQESYSKKEFRKNFTYIGYQKTVHLGVEKFFFMLKNTKEILVIHNPNVYHINPFDNLKTFFSFSLKKPKNNLKNEKRNRKYTTSIEWNWYLSKEDMLKELSISDKESEIWLSKVEKLYLNMQVSSQSYSKKLKI